MHILSLFAIGFYTDTKQRYKNKQFQELNLDFEFSNLYHVSIKEYLFYFVLHTFILYFIAYTFYFYFYFYFYIYFILLKLIN